MKSFLSNLGYFLKEAGRIVRMNLLSNIFSFLGTGLVMFILGMIISGWWIGSQMVEMLQEEAEISAYFSENSDRDEVQRLVEKIKAIDGVWQVRLVEEEEAYSRMEDVLGEEAHILELFDDNPFEAFIEVRIHLDKMEEILEKVSALDGIEHVRDNKGVLQRLQSITNALKALGLLAIAAVGITTLVIVSHMIRQGIYNNREQISTLKLLGAPGSFIGFPYILVGLMLTLGGGILAVALISFVISRGYDMVSVSLPFIPLPSGKVLVTDLTRLLLAISAFLGIAGSLFGLSSTRDAEGSV